MLKQAKKAESGKDRSKFDGVFSYLSELDGLSKAKCSASRPEHFLNLDAIDEALKVNVAFKLSAILKKKKESKLSKKDFLNLHNGREMENLGNVHTRYVIFWLFKDKVQNGGIKCQGVKKNLENLCLMYGLNQLYKDPLSCYQSGYFNQHTDFGELMLEALKLLNAAIRPQAISIIESFEFSDAYLQSAIGNSYGDIYETDRKSVV